MLLGASLWMKCVRALGWPPVVSTASVLVAGTSSAVTAPQDTLDQPVTKVLQVLGKKSCKSLWEQHQTHSSVCYHFELPSGSDLDLQQCKYPNSC